MATIGFYLDQPFDKELEQSEIKKIIENCKSKKSHYPISILNPNPSSLYMIVTFERREQIKIKLNIGKFESKYWNFYKKSFKNTLLEAESLNSILLDYKSKIAKYCRDVNESNEYYDKGDLKEKIKLLLNGTQIVNSDKFYEALNSIIVFKERNFDLSTVKEYRSLKNVLIQFEKKERLNLSFEKFTQKLFNEFELFLSNKYNPSKQKAGLLNDTINKYSSKLKHFLKWSFENDYHKNASILHLKQTYKKKSENDIVTLDEHEVELLYNFDFSGNKRLEKARDIFCFAVFTGQRHSDVNKFEINQLIENTWKFYSYKTDKITEIPLTGFFSKAKDILEKYNMMLPTLSNQKINDYIKEAGKMVGINSEVKILRYSGRNQIWISKPKYEFMSSHMARRTAVTLLLEKGMSPVLIRHITNHVDIRTLMKYENTGKLAVIEALNKIQTF